jgi:hypothetical protein
MTGRGRPRKNDDSDDADLKLRKLYRSYGMGFPATYAAKIAGCSVKVATSVKESMRGTQPTEADHRTELKSLFRRLGLGLGVKHAVAITGCSTVLAADERERYIKAIDPDEIEPEVSLTRRKQAAILLVHLLNFTPSQAGEAVRLCESDVVESMDGAIEDDLQVLLEKFPVGPGFLAWCNGLHRAAA